MSHLSTIPPDSNAVRLALTRTEAARAIGISPRSIDALIADRTSGFPIIRVGARVVVPIRLLEQWLTDQVHGKGDEK